MKHFCQPLFLQKSFLSVCLSLCPPVIFIVTLLIISCKSHKLLSLFHIVTVLYSSFLLSAALIGRASVLPFEFAHPPPSFSLLLKPIYCIFQSVVFFSSVISGSKAQNLPRQASTVHEPRTSRCTSWIQKRQRNQRSNCEHLLDH